MLTNQEIIGRAYNFVHEWRDWQGKEISESQSFWNDFFAIFGKPRREVARFEQSIKKLSGTTGRIDLFWPGTLLVEQKSPQEELNDKVEIQALDYFHGLKEKELPRYIILCNFKTFLLIDLEEQDQSLRKKTIELQELPEKISLFNFMIGEEAQFQELNEINIQAGKLMADLYEALAQKIQNINI